jgi:ABC-type transport system substrate-binding protein
MDTPTALAGSQILKQQLATIGLEVELAAIPPPSFLGRIRAEGARWDLAFFLWGPDYLDPYAYINLLLDGRSDSNLSGFNSPTHNRLMREAARLRGQERYRAYGELDIRLARDAAPLAAVSAFNEPTLVSKRVGCVVLRPLLDLTAVCLK